MAVNDILTVDEISIGLTSPSRVKELVAALQNEKDSHSQNGADSTRLWSAVAAAIAATNEKECLDLFIQLDGLHFLDNWLKCASNLSTEDTCVEDLITVLIKALEKLPIDYEKVVTSGILITVENLLAHSSSKVHGKARDIYQSWKKNSDGDDGTNTGQAVLETTCEIKHNTEIENSAEKNISLEESNAVQERHVASCSEATDGNKSENIQPFSNSVDKGSQDKDSLSIMSNASDTEKNSAVDCNADHSTTSNAFSPKIDGDLTHPILRRSSSTEKSLTNNHNFAENELLSKNASDGELDIGIVDPLEVDHQVGTVEQSCTSPEKVEVGNAPRLDSADIMNEKESRASEGSTKHMEIDENDTSPMQEDSAASAKPLDAERANVTPDVESSQVTETAQAQVNNSENEVIGSFDLNEVCSEDIDDHPSIQFPSPVSTAALKGKAALEQPAAPLSTVSACTSAFGPASPHRMLGNDIASSSGSSSKQQQVRLDIDLNVAESFDGESCLDTNSRKCEHLELDLNRASEDDGPSDCEIGQFFPQGNVHQTRSHSSSSSVMQPAFMNFDLSGQPSFLSDSSSLSKFSQNHNISDESAISLMGTTVQVNRRDVASQVHPSLHGQKPELALDLNLGRSGNNAFRIGSVLPYTHTPLYGYNNIGSGSEPAHVFAPAFRGSGGPSSYNIGLGSAPAPAFATPLYGSGGPIPYNIGPGSEPAPVFASGLYGPGGPITYMVDSRGAPVGPGGPIPYMVDSRGAPVNPQLGSSVSGLPTGYTQPPFVVNPNRSNPSYGVGSSNQSGSSFNPNYGMVVESGSGEPVGFRQFLSHGHVGPMGEQMRPNAHPPMSSVGGKRKVEETDYPPRQYMPHRK